MVVMVVMVAMVVMVVMVACQLARRFIGQSVNSIDPGSMVMTVIAIMNMLESNVIIMIVSVIFPHCCFVISGFI